MKEAMCLSEFRIKKIHRNLKPKSITLSFAFLTQNVIISSQLLLSTSIVGHSNISNSTMLHQNNRWQCQSTFPGNGLQENSIVLSSIFLHFSVQMHSYTQ